MNKWLKLFVVIGGVFVIGGVGFIIYKAIDSSKGDIVAVSYTHLRAHET